jgi:hypothetical protein
MLEDIKNAPRLRLSDEFRAITGSIDKYIQLGLIAGAVAPG